jgi:hypothetical protein
MSSSVETRLNTLQRALGAFRTTAGRRGRLVHLQDAEDVLVAGDMHGHVENFRRVMNLADLAHQPHRHLVLQEVVHGPFTYAEGGDKSHQLLDLICALKCQYAGRVHFLIGNHEMAQLTGRRVSKLNQDLNELFIEGVRTAYGNRGDEVYALYLELFQTAPLALRTDNRVYISHSLPSAGMLPDFDPAALEIEPSREADLAPGGTLYSLVWGRDVRPETASGFLHKIDADYLITGHIPCERGYDRPSERHVIIDSQTTPAGYCLVPANRPISPAEWLECAHLL